MDNLVWVVGLIVVALVLSRGIGGVGTRSRRLPKPPKRI